MEFPKNPNPINVYRYLIEYVVEELKFNPNNFIHLFSLALGVNRTHKGSYGCVFIGYPGNPNYFGDSTPDNTFSIGYKIYKDEEIGFISEINKNMFHIKENITIAIDKYLYPTNLSEIATLYYLIKKRDSLHISETMKIDKTKVYIEVKELIDYGSKVSEMIRIKHEKFEKKKMNTPPIRKKKGKKF